MNPYEYEEDDYDYGPDTYKFILSQNMRVWQEEKDREYYWKVQREQLAPLIQAEVEKMQIERIVNTILETP